MIIMPRFNIEINNYSSVLLKNVGKKFIEDQKWKNIYFWGQSLTVKPFPLAYKVLKSIFK